MSIREQILADIKEAMKAKDEFKRDTLRTLNAALKLSDDELKEKIKSIIEKVGKNLGAVMKMAKDEIGASAEAKRISIIAKELLS